MKKYKKTTAIVYTLLTGKGAGNEGYEQEKK